MFFFSMEATMSLTILCPCPLITLGRVGMHCGHCGDGDTVDIHTLNASADACNLLLQALVKSERDVGLTMTDVPKPAIGPNDVLIEVQKNLGLHYPEGAGSLSSLLF